MRLKIYCPLLIGLALLAGACQSPKVYLVRHAEKATTPANNPDLTEAGRQRAQDLCKAIPAKSLGYIYSTNYNRTLQTAAPIAEKSGVKIVVYSPYTAENLIKTAFNQHKSTLIVGHSNTLLPLIKQFGLHPSLTEIKDADYDNLFIIRKKHGQLQLLEKSYGQPTPTGEISMK